MAKFIKDLRTRLQSEHQFITSQKQLLGVLSKNVEAKLSDLYLLAWFLTYLKDNYDMVKSRVIQPVDFVKIVRYKRTLLSPEIKLAGEINCQPRPNQIFTILRQEPQIVAMLFLREDRTDHLELLARIVYTSVFGSLITAEDEFLFLKVMMELLSRELEVCQSSYDMFQKGSGFKSLFTKYIENSVEVKGFFVTLLQRYISFIMDEEVFLEFEESKAEMHACQGFPESSDNVYVNSEEIKSKIKESAKFIGTLITNLIKHLTQHISLTPYTIRILANLLKREVSKKWSLPVEAIQSCLSNLIFGFFIVPVVADPASFGLVADSLLTDRIRSNFNCMATVLQNLSRLHWRLLSPDLKLVFKFTNLDMYASYIDSLVLNQEWQSELIQGNMDCEKFKSTACFFYKKVDTERTHFLVSNSDLNFLRNMIISLSESIETTQFTHILNCMKEEKSVGFFPEKEEPTNQSLKKQSHTNKPKPSTFVLPKLMLFPVHETDWEQFDAFVVKTEEEVIYGRRQTCTLRDISKENTAIQNALKESYCIENGKLFIRSVKHRHNSISGYDTLRRQVNSICHLSSVDDSTGSSSFSEEDKSYEGDTSGIGSLANSNSSSYKANIGVGFRKKPPLPPYPSTKLPSWMSPPHKSVSLAQESSDSDTLEHSEQRTNSIHRSISLGSKEDFQNYNPDVYENAEYFRKVRTSPKKSSTLLPPPPSGKTLVAVSDSIPVDKSSTADMKVSMRKGHKLRKNARSIIKTVSTFGHSKHGKRMESLSLSGSHSETSSPRDMSTPTKDSEWSRLRSTTFTNMTLLTPPKPIPTSKYFTLLPLDASIHTQNTDITAILKRLRLFLSASIYPDFNVPEPQLQPSEIWEQINSTADSQHQISMPDDIANKRSLVSMLNHEFNLAISFNDTTRVALASDLLHIIDVMAASQVEALLDNLQTDFSRKDYIKYLTQASLKLTSQHEQIISYKKSILTQVEDIEKLFMDTEIRSYFQHNNTLSHLDLNLSLTPDKPATIHRHIYGMLEQMNLEPLWHNWEHQDAMLYSVERIVFNHTFYGLFFPNGVKDQNENEEFRIRLEYLSKILKVNDPFLSIDTKFHFSSPWPSALQLLYSINLYKAPRDKLDVISNCCKLITNLLHFTDPLSAIGADEILPVLIFVTVHSNPRYINANSSYLELYSDTIDLGENAYWFHQFLITINSVSDLLKKHEIS